MSGESPKGVLSGVRIVEFDGLGPVPLCAMLMADHGADIVRIARPGAPVVDEAVGGAILHRNRPSIILDLKNPDDQARALALIDSADAMMEGFRPGVMERLGLGPDICLSRNPKLVYGRMTGWGQTGPLAPRAGHDINYIAVSGALGAMGDSDLPPPPPLNLVGDYGGGSMFLAFGLLAGLLDARRSGRGRVVDVAMSDATPLLLSFFHASLHNGGWRDERGVNLLDGGAPFYRCYACSDGRHMAVGALEPQFFAEMMSVLDLSIDEFPQNDKARWPALERAIASRFLSRARDDWTKAFEGRDACVTPVLSILESQEHPHLQARGVFADPDGLRAPAPAPRFGDAPPRLSPPGRETPESVLARWRQ